jgi:hypothetical protein
MAHCTNCGALKLSEQICPRCAKGARERVKRLASIGRGINLTDAEADETVRAVVPLSASPSPPVGGGSDTSTSKLQSHARQDAGAQAAPPDWFVRRFMEHRHFYAAHKIDIVARKDGKEYRLEGDWLKDVVKGMAGVDVNHGAESQNDGQHQRTTTPADPHPLKHLLDQAAPFIEATNADRKSIEPPPPDAHGAEPSKPEAVMLEDSPCATDAAAQSLPSEEELAKVIYDNIETQDTWEGNYVNTTKAARAVLALFAYHSLAGGGDLPNENKV